MPPAPDFASLHPGYNRSLHVIASQRVGAKRRPMTGSAKQSIGRQSKMDCFVAYAPRNDGEEINSPAAPP